MATNVIMVPRQQNPWTAMLPQMMASMIQGNIRFRQQKMLQEQQLKQSELNFKRDNLEWERRIGLAEESKKRIETHKTTLPSLKEQQQEQERERMRTTVIPKLESLDPRVAYEAGWRMKDDGKVYTDPVHGTPEKLPSFDKVMGKRGQTKALVEAGDFWLDSKQLWGLLQKPEVAATLKRAKETGMWNEVKGMWSNKITLWMKQNGIGGDTDTATAIGLMSYLGSKERRKIFGAAVTGTEMETATAWLASPGDSYNQSINKVRMMVDEGKEDLDHFLGIYKDTANMSPFYKAFGIDRFPNMSKPEHYLDIQDHVDSYLRQKGKQDLDSLSPREAIELESMLTNKGKL